MKNALIAGAAVLGIFLLACLWLIGPILFGAVWGGSKTLARNSPVTAEWTEVTIDPAINAEYRSQSVSLNIKDIDWNSKLDGIHLMNGEILHPEL